MTGGTGLLHLDEKTVSVAIGTDLNDFLNIATGLTLSPQGFSGP